VSGLLKAKGENLGSKPRITEQRGGPPVVGDESDSILGRGRPQEESGHFRRGYKSSLPMRQTFPSQ